MGPESGPSLVSSCPAHTGTPSYCNLCNYELQKNTLVIRVTNTLHRSSKTTTHGTSKDFWQYREIWVTLKHTYIHVYIRFVDVYRKASQTDTDFLFTTKA